MEHQNLKYLTKKQLLQRLQQRFTTTEKKLSHIPSPTLLYNGEKAAKKIALAIQQKKKITLVGDYDVDGVSASAIMVDFFRQIPYPLEVIIPNRFNDGYGVSPNVLQRINTDIIITVDNGISAIQAAEICKERGIELIITDHHTPGDILPDAYTIVDPKLPQDTYPFQEICGAQVAWLVLALIKKELSLDIDMKQFLDILAIAIIADVMPLIDINRTLVKAGLKLLQSSPRPASIIIRDFINKSTISSEDIAFNIAPRLNSAGRLDDASLALEFLTATNTHTAYMLFEELNQLNEERKELEALITQEAMQCVNRDDLVIVVWGEDWHEGVIGIVASRLVDKFKKPAIVFSVNEGIAKGSARSLGEVDIYQLIKENSHYLTKFGGHKMAAGLALEEENLPLFQQSINQSAKKIEKKSFIPKENIMGILSIKDIDDELLHILKQFEPFGEANKRPLFLFQDVEVLNVSLMGKDKSHSRIQIRENPSQTQTLELIAFKTVYKIPHNKQLTCSYSVNENEYGGRKSLQLLVDKIFEED